MQNDLRERRARLKMTQAELAQVLGVTQATISRAETSAEADPLYVLALSGLEAERSQARAA